MNNNSKIIILTASTLSFIAVAIIIYLYYKNIKQSIMGTISNNYFSDKELYASNTAKANGIDNTPKSQQIWNNLYRLRDNVLNPARKAYGSAIFVNCAYRCPVLNKLVGGAATSQHADGNAADLDTRSLEGNRKLFAILVKMNNFDQLIWEGQGSWIHVSYDRTRNRKEVLAQNKDGKTYTNIKANWETAIA